MNGTGRGLIRPAPVPHHTARGCDMADIELTPDQVNRFWTKVGPPDENGCRPWLASKWTRGYGQFGVAGRPVGAHRLAWLLTYGPAWPGAVFRHSCDHPWCCEPTHITPGTQVENLAEAVARGRLPIGDQSWPRLHRERIARGEQHGNAKLTVAMVLAIREAPGSQAAIAAEFGVSQQTVSKLKRRERWDWLDGSHS